MMDWSKLISDLLGFGIAFMYVGGMFWLAQDNAKKQGEIERLRERDKWFDALLKAEIFHLQNTEKQSKE